MILPFIVYIFLKSTASFAGLRRRLRFLKSLGQFRRVSELQPGP